MDEKYLGKLIEYERRKKKISYERLAAGVTSERSLRRLEDGERISSYFILERLMERLGKSINKMEFLLHEKDYEIYYLRGIIEKAVEEGRLEKAEQNIVYYEALPLARESLHYQYICKMKAVICSLKGEGEKALGFLDQALESTLIWWKDRKIKEGEVCLEDIFEEYPIGKEEISILLLWIQQMWEEGTEIQVDGRELLSLLSKYYQDDEEERADLFSKVCWVLGSLCLKQGEEEEAYYFMAEGERTLAENRILLHLPQYLDRLVMLEKLLDPYGKEEWRKQRDALKEVFLSYDKHWDTKDVCLWKSFKMQEIYLFSELLGQERKIRNKTQELSAHEMGIDAKTISRLESGSYKPKPETFETLRNYYEICRDVCSTRIITEDFRLLEMERKISVLEHLNQITDAEKLYVKLKKKLDVTLKTNRQYILYQDMLYKHQMGIISNEEALEQCRIAFRITRPYIEPETADKVILGRRECLIINYMGICYRKMGQREKAIFLLENAMQGYKNSKVDGKYYFHSLGLIYLNLIDNYEESDRFEEALLLCEEAIRYEIDCYKCSNLGYLIAQRQFTIDRKRGNVSEDGKVCYQQAFQLMKLMKRKAQMKGLKKNYAEWYCEQLI